MAEHQRAWYGLELNPDSEVLVTVGATEAIAATFLALCEPGDEVVMFEPSYDSYAACASMAGAVPVLVRLHAPDWSFDPDELARACASPRARMVLLNTPHNPTGKVFSPAELGQVADLVAAHDLLAVTDEVYEHLVFEGTHVPLATLPGMSRAHADHLFGWQDLLLHGLEGGLGQRPGPARLRRAGGQAVPDLHQPGPAPAGGGRRAGLPAVRHGAFRRRAGGQARPALRRAGRNWATWCTAQPPPTSPPPTSRRWRLG